MEKLQRISFIFSLKTFFWVFPPPLGLPPYCEDAVLPNLMKYFDFSCSRSYFMWTIKHMKNFGGTK